MSSRARRCTDSPGHWSMNSWILHQIRHCRTSISLRHLYRQLYSVKRAWYWECYNSTVNPTKRVWACVITALVNQTIMDMIVWVIHEEQSGHDCVSDKSNKNYVLLLSWYTYNKRFNGVGLKVSLTFPLKNVIRKKRIDYLFVSYCTVHTF